MAFYDVNAAIDKPNILNSFRQGQQYGQQMRQQQQALQDQNALRQLAPQVIGGDPAAFDQAAAIDPKAAASYQGAGDAQMRRLKGAIDFIDKAKASGNQQAVEAAYQQVRPYLSKFGQEPPATFAEAEPKMEAARARIAMATTGSGDELKSLRIGANGNYWAIQGGQFVDTGIRADARTQLRDQPGVTPGIVDLRTGAVTPLGTTPGASAPMEVPFSIDPSLPPNVQANIRANPGAYAAAPDLGEVDTTGADQQSGPAATRPAVSPAEQERLDLARQANERAADAARRAADAAEAAKRGTAPAGFRFKPDGSLERIPGAPTPADKPPSQAELTAKGFHDRMAAAEADLGATVAAGYEPGNMRDYATAGQGPMLNWAASDLGQQYRQKQEDWVRAKLRKESGAVIGDDEMEREIKVYFPQPGDGPNVIQKKAESRRIAIQAMEQAAGRARNMDSAADPDPTGSPIRINSAADYDAVPSGALYIAPDGTQRRKR